MDIHCEFCKKEFKTITISHLKTHNMNFAEYASLSPKAPLCSKTTSKNRIETRSWYKHSKATKMKLSRAHKGKKLSEKTKKKISKKLKGNKLSDETINKRKAHYREFGHPSKGLKRSKETKNKISKAGIGRVPWNKGKTLSKEVKEKISKKLKGNKLSDETKVKMSIAQKGKKLSEKTKKKISKAHKGKTLSKEHRLHLLEALQRSPNKFEEKCIKLFKDNKVPLKFVGGFNEKKYFIGGKVPDFISTTEEKIIVEVFYEYFKVREYGSIENYKKLRSEIFKKHGWKTLFFTYTEINRDFDRCLKEIKKELKN